MYFWRKNLPQQSQIQIRKTGRVTCSKKYGPLQKIQILLNNHFVLLTLCICILNYLGQRSYLFIFRPNLDESG